MVSLSLSPPVILGQIDNFKCFLPYTLPTHTDTYTYTPLHNDGVPGESQMTRMPLVLCSVTARTAGTRVANPPKRGYKIPSSIYTVPKT